MITAPLDGPLTPEHHHELVLANERLKSIRRAASMAGLNGWVAALLAAVSAPFAPFGLVAALVTVGLAVVAYNEFRGRKRLLAFDPSAPTLLGWNQVGLLAMIVAYCLWMLSVSLRGAGTLAAEMQATPELADALGGLDVGGLYKRLAIGFYGAVIVLSAIFQGLNAVYYFSRRKHVDAYLRQTPQWVVDVQRITPPA